MGVYLYMMPRIAHPLDDTAALAGRLPEIAFVEFRQWGRERVVKSHAHADQFQLDYFTEGEGTYRVDGAAHAIRAGVFYFVPPGRRHAMAGASTRPPVNLTVKFRHADLAPDFLPGVTNVTETQADRAVRLFREVVSEFVLDLSARRAVAALRLAELLLLLRESRRSGGGEHPLVAVLKPFMAAHLAEPIGLDDMAKAVEVSREHLCRVFKRETGETPLGHLRSLRVERAKQLLAGGREPLTAVAERSGFADARDFHRVFKRLTGAGPRDYRRRARLAGDTT